MILNNLKDMFDEGFEKLKQAVIDYKLYIILVAPLYMVLSFALNFMKNNGGNIATGKPMQVGVLDFFVPPANPLAILAFSVAISVGIGFYTDFNGHRKVRGKVNKDIEGSARWATPYEIKKKLTAVPKNNIGSVEITGIPLASDKNNIYVDTATVNSLIVGTTRSGKGQLIVMPMLRLLALCKNKSSFVANDPKGELMESLYDLLIEQGYNVLCLNISNPENSSFYNPLSMAIRAYIDGMENKGGNISQANELVGELSNMLTANDKSDPIWPESAKALLNAMILYLMQTWYEKDRLDLLTMPNVYTFFLEYGSKNYTDANGQQRNALDDIFSTLPANNPAKLAYATSKFAEGEMRSSVFATLSSNLNIFSDVGIAMLTSRDEIKFSDLADTERPCAVFMVVPEDKKNRYVLTSMFITQCYSELTAISQKCPNRKLPRRVHFVLDEFGNMVKIPDIDVKITVCLGRNMLFNMFVQSLAQLAGKYGEQDAKTIQGNCGNLVYIQSMDKDTNATISTMLGNETREVDSFSGDKHNQTGRSSSVKGRPLMTPDEVGRLEQWHVVVLRQREFPIKSELPPWYKLGIKPHVLADIKVRESIPSIHDITASGQELMDSLGLKPIEDASARTPESIGTPEEREEKLKKAKSQQEKLQMIVDSLNILTNGKFGMLCRDIVDKNNAEEAMKEVVQMLKTMKEDNKISEVEYITIMNALENT